MSQCSHTSYETGRGDAAVAVIPRPEVMPIIKLACTACQLVYTPEPTDFSSGNTGCRRCGGWTWIAELVPAAGPGGDWLARASAVALPLTDTYRHRSAVCPDPTATPRRPAAGSGSPTTSQ